MNQFPPSPWVGPFRIFSKIRWDIRSSRLTTAVVDHRCCWHRWQIKKIFNQKNLNNFVGTPLDSRVNIYIKFCLQVHFKVSAAWYCSHCLPLVSLTPVAMLPVSLTTVANLPLVSTTLVKLVAKFAVGVVDTGGAPWLANISTNFQKDLKRS